MPRFAANLSFLFTDRPFLDRFEAAAKAGFRAVEFMFPYDFDPVEIKARLDTNGLALALFNLSPGAWDKGERGLAGLSGREAEFLASVDQALGYAKALSCPKLHCMAGLVPQGAERATYVRNLKEAAARAADAGVLILIEPINTRDMPGYLLTRAGDARDVIAEVGSPSLLLQLDIYHRHLMEGEALAAIGEFAPLVGHYQIAAPPDRGEPDSGDVDFRTIFAGIDATGYDGFVGCEYKPRGDTLAGLIWAERLGVRLG